jgi:hypothetical protein
MSPLAIASIGIERPGFSSSLLLFTQSKKAIGKLPQNRKPEVGSGLFSDTSQYAPRESAAALQAKCIVVDQQDVFVSCANFAEAACTEDAELA